MYVYDHTYIDEVDLSFLPAVSLFGEWQSQIQSEKITVIGTSRQDEVDPKQRNGIQKYCKIIFNLKHF